MLLKGTYIFLLMAAILMFGCTERIDVDLDITNVRMVVDGGISNEKSAHLFRLSTTTSYFYNQEPPPVTGAIITLQTPAGNIQLTELQHKKGLYTTPPNTAGIPGYQYRLDIRLVEPIGGSDRYSAVTRMPDTKFLLDSIQLEYNARFDFWLVKVYAWDPPTVDFYKFDTYLRGISPINDSTARSTGTPDRFFNGKNTNGFAVAFYDGKTLLPGDTIILAMSSVSEDYFRFYSQLRDASGFNNPLFDGPPANVSSNIEPEGLGFFYARKTVRARAVVPIKK